MFADSTSKLEKYIEGIGNESSNWNGIRNHKRISIISQSSTDNSIGKRKQKRFNHKMQGAIHDAVNALRDIPATLASITPSSSEYVLDELNDNSGKDESDVEIELEDEEPLEAAWERIEILKRRFNDMLRTVQDTSLLLPEKPNKT
uniref:Uncharacterized protein n=1 Tax=Loa loa TaxID=7209 RepID=A0A1I7W1Q7_LOALO